MKDSDVNLRGNDRTEYQRLKTFRMEMDYIMRGLDKKVGAINRQQKAAKGMPANHNQVCKVLEKAKGDFVETLDTLLTGEPSKKSVSFLNRYIAAYICLFQGHRPGVASKVTIDEVMSAYRSEPVIGDDGKSCRVVSVGKHKTDLQYQAFIVLDPNWTCYFRTYSHYVREVVRHRTGSKSKEFLLQFDGKPFDRVSQGIAKPQEKYGAKKYTASDSRKAIETYMQGQSAESREMMAHFLCHSEKVRDQHYTRAPAMGATRMLRTLNALNRFHRQGESNAIPDFPLQDLPAPTVPVTPQKSSPRPSTPSTSTPAPLASPERTPQRTKVERILKSLIEKAGGLKTHIVIPTPTEIVTMEQERGRTCKPKMAQEMNRKLRHLRDMALVQDTADRLLRREARRLRTSVEKLNALPEVSRGRPEV